MIYSNFYFAKKMNICYLKSKNTFLKTVVLMTFTTALNIEHVLAHGKGMYTTKVAAEERAMELNCKGTHENNGKWMPCLDEADLHKALRKQ